MKIFSLPEHATTPPLMKTYDHTCLCVSVYRCVSPVWHLPAAHFYHITMVHTWGAHIQLASHVYASGGIHDKKYQGFFAYIEGVHASMGNYQQSYRFAMPILTHSLWKPQHQSKCTLSVYFGMRASEWYNIVSMLYIERIAYMNTYIHVHIPLMHCARFSFYRAFWNNMFTTSLGYLGWYAHHSKAMA